MIGLGRVSGLAKRHDPGQRSSFVLKISLWGAPGVYMPFPRMLGQFRFVIFSSF
jgi:hypothetical protein